MRGKLARGASGPIGKLSRPRILRPRDPLTFTSLQPGNADQFGQKIDISKNVFKQRGLRRVTSRRTVRRLFRRDPYNLNSTSGIFATGATVARMSPVASQFTDNANPSFDPSKSPGAVTEVSTRSLSAEKAGKAGRGHQKVVKRTIFNQNQGKRLRRR